MQKTAIITSTATAVVLLCSLSTSSASTNVGATWWTTNYVHNPQVGASPAPFIAIDQRLSKWLRFSELARQWRVQRGMTSSSLEMAMTPAYQSIIGMGEDAIPLLIAQLKSERTDPDHWFWALSSITNANPVGEEDRGNTHRMADAWIRWAEKQGYAW